MVEILTGIGDEERLSIGEALRARVLAEHPADHRAEELEAFRRYRTELAVPG